MARWLLFLFILLTPHKNASAADIEVFQTEASAPHIIHFDGPITVGDAGKFYSLTEGISKAVVFLESPGGDLQDALAIGARIRILGLSTSVAPGKSCHSACALIWIAGTNRYMAKESTIGFHAAYLEVDGTQSVSGSGNAEVGSYLTHLGLNIEAIRFATIAGPTEVNVLTPDLARALGVDVVLMENGRIVDSAQRQSGPQLARTFVYVAYHRANCGAIIPRTEETLSRAQEASHGEGSAILGSDLWIEFMLRETETLKYESDTNGTLKSCLFVDDWLSSNGFKNTLRGPSFNCDRATLPTEITICSQSDLWADDYIMNEIYLIYRDAPRDSAREYYLQSQRAWLTTRNDCGWNADCVRRSYEARLRQLSAGWN